MRINPILQIQVEKADDDATAAFSKIADRVVKVAVDAFRAKFPKRRLEITFGMGTEIIRVDGEHMQFWWNPSGRSVVWTDEHPRGEVIPASWSVEWHEHRVPPAMVDMLCIMLDDLLYATDGYQRACPNNVNSLAKPL